MNRLRQLQQILLLGVVFLIPLQTVYILHERYLGGFKWQYGTELLYATQLLIGIVLLLQLGFWALEKKLPTISLVQLLNRRHSDKKSVIVFVLWALLSICWAHNQELGWYYFVMIALAIAFGVVVKESKITVRWLAWSLVASGVIQSLLATWQWGSQRIANSVWLGMSQQLPQTLGTIVIQTADERLLRAYGTFTHPNILGGFLALALIATVWLAITEKTKFKWLALVSIPFVTFGLGYSFSRSAWLAAIISIFVLSILEFKRNPVAFKKILAGLLIVLLSAVTFTILHWQLITVRVQAQAPLEQRSVNERVSVIDQSLQIIAQHPIIGVGIGNYTNELSRLTPNQPAYFYQPVHNIWLLITAELGIVGLALFAMLFLGALWKSRTQPVLVAFLISSFAISLFDHYLWTSWSGLLILLTLLV